MSAITEKTAFIKETHRRLLRVLQQRAVVSDADQAYIADKLHKLNDDRLKRIFADLVGWSADDRAELETFMSIALAVMEETTPSKMRNAARVVEMKYLFREQGVRNP